jgi:broad specificity phosphatase PhoE
MVTSSPQSPPESPPTRITLIRHGESTVTVNRVIGGVRTCSGLSDLGRQQAERLAERLNVGGELQPDVLLSSDFARAIETAQIIQPALGDTVNAGPFEQWADFGEHDPGPNIDGMTFRAYVDKFGTPDWSGDPHVEIFPGGETTAVFHERVERGLRELRSRFAGKHVVVACHGGVINAAFRLLLGLPGTGSFELQALNTSVTQFVAPAGTSPSWRLARYNDAAHLAGLPEATPRRDENP